MPSRIGAGRVLIQISFRNLFASKVKTAIVGGIILLGAALVVVGSSIVDSLNAGMARSIQGSLAGHLQLYHRDSRDPLQLYGGMLGESDLEPIPDFAAVKAVIAEVPGVKNIVPMGIDQAMVSSGNLFDEALAKLREDERRAAAARAAPRPDDLRREREARKAHVRRMITLLRDEIDRARAFVEVAETERAERERQLRDLERADSDAFWLEYDRDPFGGLEFLENRIAPLSNEGGFTFVRYIGTDLEAFGRAFDRMEIVEGEPVPAGQRGILLGKWYAEEYLKLKTARRLDKIKEGRERGRSIAGDEELQRFVSENQSQTRDILLQLDPARAELAAERLRTALGSRERDLQKLLVTLLQTDDGNFDERYRVFYEELAPLVKLYMFQPGDVLTIKAPTKSGYISSVNVKVYGLVAFKGLEKSNLASVNSLMDLHSFRDLYGYVTAEKAAEIRALKEKAGLRELSREEAEAELFGGGASVSASTASRIEEAPVLVERKAAGEDLFSRRYGQDEIDSGVVLNVAVILDDPGRLPEAKQRIQAAVDDAGLKLKVVDWKEAAGTLGQTMDGLQYALYGGAFILFAVAIVILNNAMIMAMLQRVKEIGTMRAIGAQRRFVLFMTLVEAVVVGIFFGALGAALGAAVVWAVRAAGGIPTTNDQLQFLFSGPSLMPQLGGASLAFALVIVFAVSVLSGLYPAVVATRITPIEAMQTEE